MPIDVICPRCSRGRLWPDDDRGQLRECPGCGKTIMIWEPLVGLNDEIAEVEAVEPAADDALDVLPAEAPAVDAPPEAQKQEADGEPWLVTMDIVGRFNRAEKLTKSFSPRQIYALTVTMLDDYRPTFLEDAFVLALGPVGVVIGFACSLALMTVLHWLLKGAESVTGFSLHSLLYVAPLLLIEMARWERRSDETKQVDFNYHEDQWISGMRWGRIENAIGVIFPTWLGLYLGGLVGFQTSLVYFSLDHLGAEMGGGFGQSLLLALDTLGHAMSLNLFQPFNVEAVTSVKHSTRSDFIFDVFKLAYVAVLGLFVYRCYQRWQLRRFFKGMPEGNADPDIWLKWIESRCGDERLWARRFFDEFMFLGLCVHHVRGHYETVRHITGSFSRLHVAKRVRDHFVDDKGNVVFTSALG